MDYFIISQDQRIPDSVEPSGILKVIDREMLKKENLNKLDKLPVQAVIKEDKCDYIDFIERPVMLISDKLKEILQKYDERIFFKPVFLTDSKRAKNNVYWLMVPNSRDCLSPKSEFNKDGSIKRAVIDQKKVGFLKIFKLDGAMGNFIIIRLDVAESILRRGFRGIKLEKLEKSAD